MSRKNTQSNKDNLIPHHNVKRYEPSFFGKWNQKGPSDREILDLCDRMYFFFKNNLELTSIEDFLEDQCLTERKYYSWKLKFEVLERTHEFIMMILSNRVMNRALRNKYSHTMALKILPMYGQKWRDNEKFFADLRNTIDDAKQKITIIEIPSYGVNNGR